MRALLLLAAVVLGIRPGLIGAQQQIYEVVSPGSLQPGQPIPPPQESVVLTVHGRIGAMHNDAAVLFDLPTFEHIGLIRFTTTTIWTTGPVTFEGVLVTRLLEMLAVPKEATVAKMTAINDYQVTIPLAEFYKWPVMIALKRDGKYMSVRDKGPLWLVYPRHAFPELNTAKQHNNWIWQLKDIVIE